MEDLSHLTYPKKSHRKPIKYPCDSPLLAEFLGIGLGDGGMTNWQVGISLNSITDLQYAVNVQQLITKLFGIKSRLMKRKGKNCIEIVISSKNLINFLLEKGAVKGNKVKQQFTIPQWINRNTSYERCFVRGLMDTDGCLYIHRHWVAGKLYKNLGLCFSSYSFPLTKVVSEILHKSGVPAKISGDGRKVYVYSYKGVERYLAVFGTRNLRIINKYREWRGD